jgi:hypothetical protein
LLQACPHEVPSWLPAKIPVRENLALIFGTVLRDRLGIP